MRRTSALAALLVLAGCAGGSGGTKPGQPAETRAATDVLRDGLILTGVKAAEIAADPDSTTTLGVAVQDGVVRLRGTVRSAADRTRVVAAARTVSGVKSVDDRGLRVDPRAPGPKERLGDFALAARIEAALTAQLGPTGVRVAVENGTATLNGSVRDRQARAAAVTTARNTTGIRNVVDRLRVERP